MSRFARNERGAAMVEMALVLPIIILLFLGMVDFGRALFLYNNLTNAAREGARKGATQMPAADIDTVAIRQLVETRIRDFSGVAAATNKVKVSVLPSTTSPSYIKVEVANYPFTPITPLPMVSSLVLNVTAIFRWEGST